MVLFHFPPIGGVPVSRNVRNVQYLRRFGWAPTVVTARGTSEPQDPQTLGLVPPGTRVIRALCLEPRHLRPIIDPILSVARAPRRSRGYPRRGTTIELDTHPLTPAPPWLWSLQRLVFFPDNQVGWLPFALFAAMRAARARKIDAVYSTAPPATAHLVAGIVKRLTGRPWVAEFRDPWLGNPITDALAGPRPWIHRRLQARVERWIVNSADRLVFVSPSTARMYRRRYPDAAQMVTITNGHDPSEALVAAPQAARRSRYRIVWTGTLDRPEELELFLSALEAVVRRRPALADNVAVDFYGNVSDTCRTIVHRFTSDGPLRSVVSLVGFVPRRVALEALAGADAALLMLGAGPGMGQFVPGKLFDYVGQSRQVLAVLPPGDAQDILRDLEWGVLAEPSQASIESAIEHLLTLPPPDRTADPEGKYDRVRLAGRLADVLDGAIARAPRDRGTDAGISRAGLSDRT